MHLFSFFESNISVCAVNHPQCKYAHGEAEWCDLEIGSCVIKVCCWRHSPLKAEPSSWRGGGVARMFCPPTADAPKRVWQGSSCSAPHSPSSIPPALSLPSITPDCIWQMPLLAPYHQVRRRQPKTILLCPYTTSVLHFAWLTHLLLQGSNGAKALSVEQLPLAKGKSWWVHWTWHPTSLLIF